MLQWNHITVASTTLGPTDVQQWIKIIVSLHISMTEGALGRTEVSEATFIANLMESKRSDADSSDIDKPCNNLQP